MNLNRTQLENILKNLSAEELDYKIDVDVSGLKMLDWLICLEHMKHHSKEILAS